jgi:hypothetical protein
MTFGFVKNCMAYKRTTVTDELTKKQYAVVERAKEGATNKLLEGATYYSNEKNRDATKGKIADLSLISDSKQITEISFISGSKNDYTKNFNDIYDQMIKFFNNETSFKSSKYKTEVVKITKDKTFYYFYKNNSIPIIVISNYKIDDDYFMLSK